MVHIQKLFLFDNKINRAMDNLFDWVIKPGFTKLGDRPISKNVHNRLKLIHTSKSVRNFVAH